MLTLLCCVVARIRPGSRSVQIASIRDKATEIRIEDRHLARKGYAVPEFCPDGYVSTKDAIGLAARHWFSEQVDRLEAAVASQSSTRPMTPLEQAAQAFSLPHVNEQWREIENETVHRLRSLLHQGELKADYFDTYGRHSVPREFWATTQADRVLESGMYWPFGQPSRVLEWQQNYRLLFLRETELQKLLTERPAEKRRLPRSKIPELVAALRELGGNRQAQYGALCELPQFREFEITRADFREAARHLPRKGGRKSRRESRR